MAGQQGPQSPSSADAPSPKRQRLDGQHFNGQPIGPMGRGQPQGLQAQQGQQVGPSDPDQLMKQLVSYGINPNSLSPSQFNNLQMQNPNVQAKSMQVYAQSMRQQMQNALESNAPKGMPNPAGMVSQGSPAMDANPEFFNGQMRVMPGAAANAANNSNHALQDYQMQLMLLEQQNKKRLLMARQEQDNMTSGPGGPVPPGQPGFAPAMSPQNSRAGPSPNPNEQMKRGTPKMAPGAVPSPTPDGGMPQGRASPAPGFDPNQMNPNMPPNMYNHQMGMRPGMMPNGQMMQPPSSHPGFNGQLNPQQMEMMRQSGGRLPNGQPFPPNPQGMMMPGQPQQPQPPNMTPQQRNAAMPPPPAPPGGQPGGTQPSSPQPNAPPTPSQANKPNPKKKNDPKSNKVSHLSFPLKHISKANVKPRRHPQRRVVRQLRLPHPKQNSRRRPHPTHQSHLRLRKASTSRRTVCRSRTRSLTKDRRTACHLKHLNPTWVSTEDHSETWVTAT